MCCAEQMPNRKHLASGSDKGSSLREAKLDLLQQFGDEARPIYWAGFTFVSPSLI
jgi:CHAT domain-containing protein